MAPRAPVQALQGVVMGYDDVMGEEREWRPLVLGGCHVSSLEQSEDFRRCAMINALPKFCMMEEAVLSFFPLHGLVALLDFLVNVCTMMVCTFLLVLHFHFGHIYSGVGRHRHKLGCFQDSVVRERSHLVSMSLGAISRGSL